MEIVGIGSDIVSLKRINDIVDKERFAEYILLPEEYADFAESVDKTQYLASRFAAKEAVIKASPQELTYHDFLITKDGKKPIVSFLAGRPISSQVFLSIAHEFDYAVAFAVVC